MRHEVLGAGLNVVIDSVLSNADTAVGLGEQLAAAGYSIEVLDVEVPYELSAARISSRWRLAYENALATGEGLGGRWVPSTYARDVFDPATGRAFSQESALRLASECEAVLRYRRFWTAAEDVPRVVEEDLVRTERGAQLQPAREISEAAQGARAAGGAPFSFLTAIAVARPAGASPVKSPARPTVRGPAIKRPGFRSLVDEAAGSSRAVRRRTRLRRSACGRPHFTSVRRSDDVRAACRTSHVVRVRDDDVHGVPSSGCRASS